MDNNSSNYEDIPKYIAEIESLKEEIKILNERQTQMLIYMTEVVNDVNKGFSNINKTFQSIENFINSGCCKWNTSYESDDNWEDDDDDEDDDEY